MKTPFIITFLLFTTQAYAQQVHLQGCVRDAQTGQPIAATTISMQSKDLFYPADDAGKFNIETDSLTTNDSLSFSCVGYKARKIKASDLFPGIIIKLEANIAALQEVKIIGKPSTIIAVGSKYKLGKYSIPLLPDFNQAAFMEGSKNVKGIIRTVGFYLDNGVGTIKGGDITTPFRIRVFEVDPNGMPGDELTKDVIVVHGVKNNAWFDTDISAYHIQNPDSGFYVSFSLLTDEYYQINKSIRTADSLNNPHSIVGVNPSEIITPRLGMMPGKKIPQRSYFSNPTMFWIKDRFNFSYLIRATITSEAPE